MSLENRKKNAQIWSDRFHLSVGEVFSEDGIEYIDKMTAGQRLALLRFASRDDHATLEMFESYFASHPEDIDILYLAHSPGTTYEVDNSDDFMITSLAAPSLVRAHPDLKESLGQYLEIADRRSAMPEVLIDGPDYYVREELFGDASRNY